MKVCAGSMGEKIFVGGTLAANPISMAACYYALKYMDELDAVGKATAYANRLTRLSMIFMRRVLIWDSLFIIMAPSCIT